MTRSLQPLLDHLVAQHHRGRTLGLLFDYDGTLAPTVTHPSLARLARAARVALRQLVRRPRVAIGVISGRSLDDLKPRIDMPAIYLAGISGLELEWGGNRIHHRAADRAAALLRRVAQSVRAILPDYPDAWREDKGLGLTLHYRALASKAAAELQHQAIHALQPFQGKVQAIDQVRALEITPALGWDKGTAVRRILDHAGVRGLDAVYAGDAANDTEAMQAIVSLGGTTIGIGDQAPGISQYRLSEPAELHRFLRQLSADLVK